MLIDRALLFTTLLSDEEKKKWILVEFDLSSPNPPLNPSRRSTYLDSQRQENQRRVRADPSFYYCNGIDL
jgi:hypothetical protein